MEIINIIEKETHFGIKAIALYWGDITQHNSKIDLLIVSAAQKGYTPVEGTVIGSLKHTLGIDVNELSQNSLFDFSESLGVWISKEIDNPYINRIACIEIIDRSGKYDLHKIETKVNSLFGLLNFCQMHNIFFKEIVILIGVEKRGPELLIAYIFDIEFL
jgi:hypothetical protein